MSCLLVLLTILSNSLLNSGLTKLTSHNLILSLSFISEDNINYAIQDSILMPIKRNVMKINLLIKYNRCILYHLLHNEWVFLSPGGIGFPTFT